MQAFNAAMASLLLVGVFGVLVAIVFKRWIDNGFEIPPIRAAVVALAAAVAVSAKAQTIDCATACTVTIVHDFSLPVLNIDETGGALIAGAILAVWAVGFGARAIIRALNSDGETSSTSGE